MNNGQFGPIRFLLICFLFAVHIGSVIFLWLTWGWCGAAELLTQASRQVMIEMVAIVISRLRDLPSNAPQAGSYQPEAPASNGALPSTVMDFTIILDLSAHVFHLKSRLFMVKGSFCSDVLSVPDR